MEKLTVIGGKKLNGSIDLQGSKNSALPILAATVAVSGVSVIHNCPCLSDVSAALKILEHTGCKIKREGHTVIVDSSGANRYDIPDELMREMRSSIVFAGALLARFSKGCVSPPGGCEIGLRPIDLHLNAFRQMGVEVCENAGRLLLNAKGGVKGHHINLSFPSVGATENVMLASLAAKEDTVITNAAREPEIVDLAEFLNKCGAKIKGAGHSVIHITPCGKLSSAEHSIIPDRIVASTFMACAACTGSEICIKGVVKEHLNPVIHIFSSSGCDVVCNGSELTVKAPERLSRVRYLRTMPYPGFPTDSQALIMAMLVSANGTSIITEKIFENRFRHVPELIKMGADIRVENGCVAVIEGVKTLSGARVYATDLRGGSALVAAALGAQGETVIEEIHHIDRGCEGLEKSLASLGAQIIRID